MTDRELLELAAKAAGYAVCEPFRDGEFRACGHDRLSFVWNPLDDDGDALRLAVALGISERDPVRIFIEYQFDGEQDYTCIEYRGNETTHWHLDDPYAATRRAIVRAAAAIGEAMP